MRNLKLHNKSLLYKWLWKFNDGKEVTWKKLVDIKYEREGNWAPKPVKSTYGLQGNEQSNHLGLTKYNPDSHNSNFNPKNSRRKKVIDNNCGKKLLT